MLPVSVTVIYCLGYKVKLQKWQIESHCAFCLVLKNNILFPNIGLNVVNDNYMFTILKTNVRACLYDPTCPGLGEA